MDFIIGVVVGAFGVVAVFGVFAAGYEAGSKG